MELADTSAWQKRHLDPDVDQEFVALLEDDEIATCDMVRLELLLSTQDAKEFADRRGELAKLSDWAIEKREWRRALDVLEALSRRGPLHHRQVKLPDLLIAAAAEAAEVPVLHYDRHFELIAEVTGQPVRAIAPLGSL
jgi:predicted nucleic acid-binding protein